MLGRTCWEQHAYILLRAMGIVAAIRAAQLAVWPAPLPMYGVRQMSETSALAQATSMGGQDALRPSSWERTITGHPGLSTKSVRGLRLPSPDGSYERHIEYELALRGPETAEANSVSSIRSPKACSAPWICAALVLHGDQWT